MTEERPFRMLEDLFRTADAVWYSLTPADWLIAFAAHPKIGSTDSGGPKTRASEWSAGEQAGTAKAQYTVKKQLAEANSLYEEKFGFIFIVCATGRSADEMLDLCNARLQNRLGTEMMIAAEEQRKITELRLNKLLEHELHYNTRP
jgi:OHCU decarboxylase